MFFFNKFYRKKLRFVFKSFYFKAIYKNLDLIYYQFTTFKIKNKEIIKNIKY